MLLNKLYVISLERPEHWCVFLGTTIRGFDDRGVRVEYLRCYIGGLCDAAEMLSPDADDIAPFMLWLRDVRQRFPQRGWCAEYLDDSDGDHIAAIRQFFGYLYEYLVETHPQWFIEFNRSPQPAMMRNGQGIGVLDVRIPEHIDFAVQYE